MELYGSIQSISGSMTASVFTGSFVGDGSGLYGISADGVTGLNLSQISTGSVTASVSPNGFNVNTNTSITGTLKVSGTIIAEQIDVTVYSSSVLFQSGSTKFGDSLDDNHTITGSVNITGSISLNGQAIGTGKLDETTFQSYTSSNNSRVSALETSSGSLNSFTSSINTTIKSKLDSDNVISGSVQVNITGTTGYSAFSSSVATTDLNQENRLSTLETSSGSLNSFTSSINTTIKSKLDSDNVISGSQQVDITNASGYSTFSSSISNNINSLSSSVATTTSGLTSTITSLSSSLTSSLGLLGSNIESLSSSVATTTLNLKNRVDTIETSTGSLNTFTSSINTTIKSKLDSDNVISGSIQVNLTESTGYSTFSSSVSESITNLSSSVATTTSGLTSTITSLSSSVATTTSGLTSTISNLSSSVATTTSGLTSTITSLSSSVSESIVNLSSSVATTTNGISTTVTNLSSSVATTTSGLSSSIGTLSSSVATTTNDISTTVTNLSSSIATTDLNQSNRLVSIEGKTGSYATTGSNVFQGDQTITGSLYVSQNLIIAGSSSIQHISSSVVNIADNIITVNAQNPSIRFGGLAVIDSGSSPQVSGSILFDSVNDQWIFVHQNQTTVTSSILLMGPQTYNNLGGEAFPTNNRLLKAVNAEHLGDSNISDNGTTVTILSNTVINGTITSTGTTIVSGSSQISHDSTTGYVANRHIDHTAVSITAGDGLSGGGDISATRTVTLDTGSVHFLDGVKKELNTEGVISGSSQVLNGSGVWSGSAQLPSGVVSGSSQVLNGSGVWSGSAQLPSGVVSGSSQVLVGTTIHSGSFFNGITVVSGSGQISFNGITDKPTLVSGSSQITYSGISSIPSGIVSGSAQIDLTSTTNYSSGIKTRLNAEGVISGSSQVTGIGNSQLTNSSFNIGTTSISLGRASASQTLTGVSIDGASATAPTLTATNNTILTQAGSGTIIHSYAISSSTSGLFSTGDNSNSIITINRHPDNYYSQLGFNSTGGIFYRSFNNAAINTSQGWQTVWTSSSLTNLNQLTNGPGYITGISFANVSGKPTTISGYGITDAITTSNISSQTVASAGNSTTVGGITPIQFFNNMGDNHSTRTSFDASTPSYNFGFRYVQGSTNGPGSGGGQFYSWYIGLGNDYPATGGGSYGAMFAVDRNTTSPYLSVRYNENNSFGSWRKISAGYADTAGTAGNITAYTINQSVGTSSTVQFGSLGVGVSPALTVHFRGSGEMVRFENTSTGTNEYTQLNFRAGSRNGYIWLGNQNASSWAGDGGLNIYTDFGNMDFWTNAIQRTRITRASGALLHGDVTVAPDTNAWLGTAVFGVSGYNKVIIGSLNSSTTGAYVGGHNSALSAWANLNIAGEAIIFRYQQTERARFDTSGHFIPGANNAYNLGSASLGWANVYTNDLHLSNMNKPEGNDVDGTNGTWTIQEGAENLYIINNNNGKKFKISLEEII